MYTIRAKYRILSVTKSHSGQGLIKLGPTYGKNGEQFPENLQYWQWTPSGTAEFIEGYQGIEYVPNALVFVDLVCESDLSDVAGEPQGEVWDMMACEPSPTSRQLHVKWCRKDSKIGSFEMNVQNPTAVRHLHGVYTEQFWQRLDAKPGTREEYAPSRWRLHVSPAEEA